MSQKKVYLFSPDGKEEGWFMEDETPAGWVRTKPESKEDEGDGAKPDELSDAPDNGEPHSQEIPNIDSTPDIRKGARLKIKGA